MSLISEPKPGDPVVCETRSGAWSYHLRVIGGEGFKPGGGTIKALCGRMMGWDTRIPLATYGKKNNTPSTWCEACLNEAKAKGLVP